MRKVRGSPKSIVGVPRSTLYRWREAPEPKSRRPHNVRKPVWSPALVEAVEALGRT